jgi:hypothetical protein
VKRPFLMIEVCVRDEHELSELTQLLRSIAVSDGMSFTDYSRKTSANLSERRKPTPMAPTENLDMGAFDPDGAGFGVSDTKMFSNQITIGFSEGSNPSKAHRIADEVAYKLKAHWQVGQVPSGGRVLPNLHCKANS